MDSPQEFTVEQAAEYCGVSERTFRNDIAAGRVAFVKRPVGNTRKSFFSLDELDRYKAEREEKMAGSRVPRKPEWLPSRQQPLPGMDAFTQALQAVAEVVRDQREPAEDRLADLNAKKILTIAEAARLSGLSESAIRAAIRSGDLKGRLIGKGYKTRPEDLDDYIGKLFQE